MQWLSMILIQNKYALFIICSGEIRTQVAFRMLLKTDVPC